VFIEIVLKLWGRSENIYPMKEAQAGAEHLFLGIEGGGSQTVALLAGSIGSALARRSFGPGNLQLLDTAGLAKRFREIRAWQRSAHRKLAGLAIGMAGARTDKDRERIRSAAAGIWPGVPCYATNDLETALAAAEAPDDAGPVTRVLVVSGTGSCCVGRTPGKKPFQFGGWGHLLGDKGSGYEIGLRALRASVFYFDRDGEWSRLGQQILSVLQLNEPNDLIPWVKQASKDEIAALAVEVFAAAQHRNAIALDILTGAAASLAKDAAACARRLVKPGTPVQFVFSGSVLLKQPAFARKVAARIRELWPESVAAPLQAESAWGAIELAREQWKTDAECDLAPVALKSRKPSHSPPDIPTTPTSAHSLSPALPLTEQRHPASMQLDRLPLSEAISLMLREDERIPAALRACRKEIERSIRLIVRAFKQGGRLFYVGAGTSGRLGILDASECPPTFRTPPGMVQGIIAGGQRAIWSAVEGAEDAPDAGARAIHFRGVNARDVVVGIAASGRTPFVWGALRKAKQTGAKTLLIAFDPELKTPRDARPTETILPNIGPEILTGSTRLKAGTATKLILNLFTTLAMVQLGKVMGNLMVDLNPSNTKLRGRAVRIVRELTGATEEEAQTALEKAGWVVKKACKALGRC
jgi:N-acetylmuramic acid 6-phosphate etherase